MKREIILPYAPILVESTRSIGYSFESALADIIDNSISKNAKEIHIRFNSTTPQYVAVIDDACGMNQDELIAAMRYGSKSSQDVRDINDLGRFGLGLKMASLSQCRKLTVITKQGKKIYGAQWDLDYIIDQKDWALKCFNETEINNIPFTDELREKESGTVVLWESFDRMLNGATEAQKSKVFDEKIEIARDHPQTIDAAYEKYRYGLKPGFTLFWAKRSNDISFDKDSLETKIKEFISTQKYGEDDKYKNLEFVSIIEFGGTYEISLSYLQKFNYINEEGEFTYIYMMKECFAWIGIDKNFIAINNMPEVLMNALKRFFSSLYSADITNIKITSKLLEKVFPSDKTKRVTRHNANPPENQLEKITFADQNLGDKKDCIPDGYEDYDITNTQYVEDIDENTTGTLGVNCNKGKMYLSKSLTSSQFRAWSTRRIDNIISFFQNSSDVTLETVSGFNMFSSSSWDDIKQSSIPILNEIALAIITCKKSNIDSYPVSFELYKAYVELNSKFYEKVYCLCDTCEEPSIPSCPDCGGTHFAITKKAPAKIVCSDCGKAQGGPFVFDCENGHTNTIADINDAISLIATDDFTEQLLSTIKLYYPDIAFIIPLSNLSL